MSVLGIKSLKVGHRRIKVEGLSEEAANEAGVWGDYYWSLGRLRVQTENLSPALQAETLIHEILHGLTTDAGLVLNPKQEERIVRPLAVRLVAFMQDNPKAMRKLLTTLLSRRDRA